MTNINKVRRGKQKQKYSSLMDMIFVKPLEKNTKDGGTIVGIHKGLKPMLIEEYSDDFELIVQLDQS